MKVTKSTVTQLLIEDVPGLDPIRVVIENISPGKGMITIVCFARAWTAGWGAMGKDTTLEHFFCVCNSDYLHDSLVWGMTPRLKSSERYERKHLINIIETVQRALIKLSEQETA